MTVRIFRKCGAIFVLAMVLGVSVLAMPAAANGDDWKKGWPGGKWDKDWYRYGGGYPGFAPGYSYPVAYPVAYPVYVPAQFGGDQGACYQACVNSGRYPPAQCGQWCYYA